MEIVPEIESKESLVRFLDNQIEYLFRVATLPGWTIWTLAGTLATILWLVAKDLSLHPINPYHAGIIFVYLAFLVSIFPFKEFASRQEKAARFIVPREVFYGHQRAWLYYLFKNLLYSVVLYFTFKSAFSYFSAILIVYWVFIAIFCAAIVLISFGDIPFPRSGDSPVGKLYSGFINFAWFAITLLWLSAFYGYTDYVFRENNFSLIEFKIPVFVLIAMYLLEKIIEIDTNFNSGVIKSLAEIRTRLVLNEMPYAEAYNNVKVTLLGYATAEIFKRDFDSLRMSFQEVLSSHQNIVKLMGVITAASSVPVKDMGREKADIVRENMAKLGELVKNARNAFKELKESHDMLTLKMGFMSKSGYDISLYAAQSKEVEKFFETIQSELVDIETKAKELKDKFTEGR